MSHQERVLIVGGGFGGVKAALELSKDERFRVTLLSDSTDFRYYPTLYRRATGGRRANSSIPLATLFLKTPVTLVQGNATRLDRAAHTITTADKQVLPYDTLILGLGVVTNYFGIKGLKDYSFSIKSQSDADRFKAHLHKQLADLSQPDLHYVVVGGGPTGIELAGALPSYLKRIMKYHGLERRAVHVDLVEAAPRLLPRLPKDVSRRISRRLKRLGVRLYLNMPVRGETADYLLAGKKPIRSHTVVWTAGVTTHPFFSHNDFVITKRGKVSVDTYLQAEDNIFVIGDNANTPHSGLAQTALLDGAFVAWNLKRRASGKEMGSYLAKRPITVIPVGEHWAMVLSKHLRVGGFIGYLLREAADFIGFLDIESWDRATRQWLTAFGEHEECAVCNAARIK